MRRRLRPMLLLGSLLAATTASAHWPAPEEVIARIRSGPDVASCGLVEVGRDPRLERLLVIRVEGAHWDAAGRRVCGELAERWRRIWRRSVARGVVAIVDAESGDVLVNFGPGGRARLR